MKVLGLIPARKGSKGIFNKNIIDLGGHPLLAWSIKACQKSLNISKVVVSTDSNEYASIAKAYGADVPFLRPNEISQDNSSDYEFVKHAIDFFENLGETYDLIAHIRPTSPLREDNVIDNAIETFNKLSISYTSLRSIHEMSESAYKCFELAEGDSLKPIGLPRSIKIDSNAPRQVFPKTFFANGYVDILRVNHVKRSLELHGDHIYGFRTMPISELDVPGDLDFIRYECEKFNMVDKMFGVLDGPF